MNHPRLDSTRPARDSLQEPSSAFPSSSPRLHAGLPGDAYPESRPEGLFDEYVRVLSRHRLTILVPALLGVMIGLLFGLPSEPVYRTHTVLEIRSINGDFMNLHSVAPTGDNSPAGADTNFQTQIKLLDSDTLLQQTANTLFAKPHPASIVRQDLISRFARTIHVGGRATIPYTALVDQAVHSVTVKPLGLTRLVSVTCDSYDPQFSAIFCNTLVRTFEDQGLETRSVEAQKTSAWLTKQVSDVRQRAEEDQKKLEQAVGGNGLMLSQATASIGENRLRSLQDEMVKAEGDRMKKQADAELARVAPADTLPGVQDNPAHRAYELKLADLQSQLSQLVPTLTDANPKVVRLRSQIKQAQAGLLTTQSSSTRRADNEFTAAIHREHLLHAAYKAQESAVSTDLQKAAQVSLLRKELDSEQSLYETLLQRAKEAGFASAVQAATIRIVDTARVPKETASPKRKLAGSAGLALGALGGIGLAFFRERNNKAFRIPGEVTRLLQVPELGVIPAAVAAGEKLRPISPRIPRGLLSLATSSIPEESEALALARWGDDFSIVAEAYRNATYSILLSNSSKRSRSYVVTSPSSGEGKTSITSNLGVALSKSRLRVVLIDGDLRRPALHRAFALENRSGLREILRGEVNLETTPTASLVRNTKIPNVSIISAGQGPGDIVGLLHSPYFGAMLARLSRDFDVILVDSPPILHMADARILAGQSDGVILVLRAGLTTSEQAVHARDLFQRDGVRLVGTLLNDFDPRREGMGDYYKSSYSNSDGDSAV